jgi:hypothetical protein
MNCGQMKHLDTGMHFADGELSGLGGRTTLRHSHLGARMNHNLCPTCNEHHPCTGFISIRGFEETLTMPFAVARDELIAKSLMKVCHVFNHEMVELNIWAVFV